MPRSNLTNRARCWIGSSTLVRESGTPTKTAAGRYIVARLQALGVPVTLHTPDLYISIPERAALGIVGSAGAAKSLRARPPAMARSTGDNGVEGEVCYVPSRYAAGHRVAVRHAGCGARGDTQAATRLPAASCSPEGFSMPGHGAGAFERRGAIAQIYIHPGERIHEGICTSIWGAPTIDIDLTRKPTTPVVVHQSGRTASR